MDENYQKTFSKNDSKNVYINGHTKIRAGVTKPKIIIY